MFKIYLYSVAIYDAIFVYLINILTYIFVSLEATNFASNLDARASLSDVVVWNINILLSYKSKHIGNQREIT